MLCLVSLGSSSTSAADYTEKNHDEKNRTSGRDKSTIICLRKSPKYPAHMDVWKGDDFQ